jgi:hypothetical protein
MLLLPIGETLINPDTVEYVVPTGDTCIVHFRSGENKTFPMTPEAFAKRMQTAIALYHRE